MSLITPEAHDRMFGHTLHEQLTKHRAELSELLDRKAINELEGKLIDRRIRNTTVLLERRKDGT